MSKLWKTIVSILSVVVVGVAGILLYIYWPAIKGTINSNKYYTAEDLQDSYDKGFDDGNKSETELSAEITYYKNLVDEYEVEVASLNKELNDLTTKKLQNEENIASLTAIKNENEKTINTLQNTVNKNNEDIENYKNQIAKLQSTNTTNQMEIDNLNNQVSSYQTMIKQLQDTNDINAATIASLNNQILHLNNQISELSLSSGTYTSQINALNNKINELQTSVNYYESYIANLETSEQVVATFEFNGSVYNIQIVNKGSKLSISNPESTDYLIFNGWKVDEEFIDLSSYTIQTNTKIIADITYKYDVKFIVDSEIYNSQIIVRNEFATIPKNPIKDGYEFDGWTLNGVDIIQNIDTMAVEKNTTYVAKFTKLHKVTFKYEDTIIETQTIRNNETATIVNIENTPYKVFNGWKVDDIIIDITNYKILMDTSFIADITYKFDVVFMVDDVVYNNQIVTAGTLVDLPEEPIKDGFDFDGWTINGSDIIDLSATFINTNTTFIAKFSTACGLFDADTGVRIMSWKELLENDYLVEDQGVLSKGTNVQSLSGKLKMPNSITSIKDSTESHVSGGMFYKCTGLTEIIFSENLVRIGKSAFYSCTGLTELNLPSKLVEIGNYAFGYCSNLTSVNIPSSLKEVGSWAFRECNSLNYVNLEDLSSWASINFSSSYSNPISYAKSLYLNNEIVTTINLSDDVTNIGSYAFYYCESITEVNLPSNLTEIGKYAFAYCSNIESMNIPSSLKTIGEWVFRSCSSLTKVNVTDLSSWASINFIDSYSTPLCYAKKLYLNNELVTEVELNNVVIGQYAFYYCSDITIVKFSENLTSIGKYAFYHCEGITEINFPSNLSEIGEYAFNCCSGLTGTINLPNKLITLSQYVFQGCKNVEHFNVSINLVTIGRGAFYDCYSLLDIILPDTVETIDKYAFMNCKSITSFTVPSKLTIINEFMLYGCTNLSSINFNELITEIGQCAFFECTSLLEINIPNSVLSIGASAFSGCHALKKATLSQNLTTISGDAFHECWTLKTIYIPITVTTIETISSRYWGAAFYGCSTSFVIYCGASSKQDGWSDDFNRSYHYDDYFYYTTKYGYTYSDYISETGAVE